MMSVLFLQRPAGTFFSDFVSQFSMASKKERKEKKNKVFGFKGLNSATIAEVCYPKLALVMLYHLRCMLLSWLPNSQLSTHFLQSSYLYITLRLCFLSSETTMSSFFFFLMGYIYIYIFIFFYFLTYNIVLVLPLLIKETASSTNGLRIEEKVPVGLLYLLHGRK